MVPLDHGVLLVGGGEHGEGVGRRDNHRDGAILDLRTGRWRSIADAPFGMVSGSGISTGDAVILFGVEIGCEVVLGERSCRTGTVHAARYDLAADEWRELRFPPRWAASTSVCRKRSCGMATLPSSPPSAATSKCRPTVTCGWRQRRRPRSAVGDRSTGSSSPRARSARQLRVETAPLATARVAPERGPGELALYDSTGSSWSTAAAPAGVGGASLCVGDGVVLVDNVVTAGPVLTRYELDADSWSPVQAPPVPAGVVPCSLGQAYPSCDLASWSAHGRFLDVWYAGHASGARYDARTGRWTEIAPGPDAVSVAWIGDLGVTFGTADGRGSGPGDTLLVYRPA